MAERDGIFMAHVEAQYPGFSGGNGFVENLASYRENVRWFEPGKAERSNTFQFDIERHVEWDNDLHLLPFTYSAMASADYPIPSRIRNVLHLPSGPTREEFEAVVKTLPGFQTQKDIEQNSARSWHENPSLGIFVNWTISSDRYAPKHITVAVVYDKEVSTLETLVQQVLPGVVKLSNIVNPTRQLVPSIVTKTILLARERDAIVPKRRPSHP